MQQIINQFTDTIRAALASRMPLRIRGGGGKDFYGGKPQGEIFDTRPYSGIVQ